MRRTLCIFATVAALAIPVCAQETDDTDPTPVGFWARLTFSAVSDEIMWDQLVEAGCTDLFVETFYHGFVIYPESNIFDQRPQLMGIDPLRWAIDEAHARGIRLHAWVEILRWGPDYERHPQIPQHPLVGEVDDWLVRTLNGETYDEFFVSPANAAVRDKVTRLCLDIAHRYGDIDGINLDYIRWPARTEAWYDAANLGPWIAQGRADPRTDRSEENLAAFRQHTADQVTELVRTISITMRGIFPSVRLSAAIFPDPDEDNAWAKAQDWAAWLREGLLDFITPMCYAQDIAAELDAVEAQAGDIPVWAGLAVHAGTDHAPAVEQLDAIQGHDTEGVVFFSHGWVAERPEEFGEIGAWFEENSL